MFPRAVVRKANEQWLETLPAATVPLQWITLVRGWNQLLGVLGCVSWLLLKGAAHTDQPAAGQWRRESVWSTKTFTASRHPPFVHGAGRHAACLAEEQCGQFEVHTAAESEQVPQTSDRQGIRVSELFFPRRAPRCRRMPQTLLGRNDYTHRS